MPPPKLRVYLDTSVPSALLDDRDPVRQQLTRQFWERLSEYDPWSSTVAVVEANKTTDLDRRGQLLALINELRLLSWTEEMDALTDQYLTDGVFASGSIQDARHVAACSVSGIPVLLSWNFRHLVSRTRRLRVNLVNSRVGYGQLEIVAPPELF